MCGRATLTIVASRTTMSWAVRITNRNTVGLAEPPARTRAAGGRPSARFGATRELGGMGHGVRPFRCYREDKRKLPPDSIRRVPPFCNASKGPGGRQDDDRAGAGWHDRRSRRATRRGRWRPGPPDAGRRQAQLRQVGGRREEGLPRAGRRLRPSRRSPRRRASGRGRCTGTSRSGSTSSRRSTGRTSTGSCPQRGIRGGPRAVARARRLARGSSATPAPSGPS